MSNKPESKLIDRIKTSYQRDMERRIVLIKKEIAIEKEERYFRSATSHHYPTIADAPQLRGNQQLEICVSTPNRRIKLVIIKAAAFDKNYHRREITGIFTIYEINSEINRRKLTGTQYNDRILKDNLILRELLYNTLPPFLRDYMDFFLKKASNKLPLNRKFDHRITLLEDLDTKYSPLYKISTPELEEVRRYILKNIDKGFIILNDSPFTSLILFIKKKDGSLRFCVDYRKLNIISKKDRYPLPLI